MPLNVPCVNRHTRLHHPAARMSAFQAGHAGSNPAVGSTQDASAYDPATHRTCEAGITELVGPHRPLRARRASPPARAHVTGRLPRLRDGAARSARRAHNPEAVGSNPAPATGPPEPHLAPAPVAKRRRHLNTDQETGGSSPSERTRHAHRRAARAPVVEQADTPRSERGAFGRAGSTPAGGTALRRTSLTDRDAHHIARSPSRAGRSGVRAGRRAPARRGGTDEVRRDLPA